MIYSCLTQILVKEKGYDSSLLEDDFDDLKDFWYAYGLDFFFFTEVKVEVGLQTSMLKTNLPLSLQ